MKSLSEHVILVHSKMCIVLHLSIKNLWGYVYTALNSIDDSPLVCLNNALHH